MMPYAPSRFWLVAALVLAAIGVRLMHLDQSLLGFHPTRQFRSAIIARSCYVDHSAASERDREVAHANRAMQPAGEPPILEWVACSAYSIVGREDLRIPRVLSAAAWVAGAVPLYLLTRRLSGAVPSLVALSTYLFTAYGIVASRAFQPDALMTSASLFALLSAARYFERPARLRFVIAAAAIAAAALIKPMSIFLTVPATAGLGLAAASPSRAAIARVLLAGLIPALIYYGHGAIFGTLARDQMRLRFVPSLVPSEFFWSGLWTQVSRVLGPVLFLAAAVGTIVAERSMRLVLVSLWAGYLVFAIAFTYHMPTHDYYHLPYIAPAALGVAALAGFVEQRLAAGRISRWASAAVGLVTVIMIAGLGIRAALPVLSTDDRERIAMYEEIGALAEHHSRVLFLDTEYGYPLMYHGRVAGDSWPSSDDLTAERLGGAPSISAADRYARDFAEYAPAFFIVTDLRSLHDQPDLQTWLDANAVAIRQTARYHVYRLVPDLVPAVDR
jgi:hypothetical protein